MRAAQAAAFRKFNCFGHSACEYSVLCERVSTEFWAWHAICEQWAMMQSKCCYCYRSAPKFAAQHTLKHAFSHGLCGFHAKFELLKFKKELARIETARNGTAQNQDTKKDEEIC